MTPERRPSPLFSVLAALVLPLGALAQETRLGSEFQVNTYTTGYQRYSSVAADADGDFVVAWESYGQDGSSWGIFTRRFSSAGSPLAVEFQVNTYTANQQRFPSVKADADGDFVVAWQSHEAQDGSSGGVFARRFSSAGVPLAGEFQVNVYTTSGQSSPSVAVEADGDFVVAWSSYQGGSRTEVFARRFSSAGAPLTGELQINTYTTELQSSSSITVDADGDFVVAWSSYGQDGSSVGIFARRFSSAGNALGGQFQVNTYTTDGQRNPSVTADGEGDLVVAWDSNQDGYDHGVFARRFDSAGVPLGVEFQVNTYTNFDQRLPSVAADSGGDFVVAWQSLGQDGASSYSVFARHFSSAGLPLASEFQVNTYTTKHQRFPSVAAEAAGDFVVVWTDDATNTSENGQDGSFDGVFAQRFAVPIVLDIDGNGSVEALTDGLLVLRFLFGFVGTTLTSGAVGDSCTRCDAPAIEAYIGELGLVLDIDGNTMTGALTDGLLALRYLFGFTGATLVTGAVDLGDCTRCDSAAIEAYLQGLI